MRTIKFCFRYKNINIIEQQSIEDMFIYHLNERGYYTKKSDSQISFNRHSSFSTDRSKNTNEGSIILNSGSIFFYNDLEKLKVCWLIDILSVIFRAVVFGFIVGVSYYFFNNSSLLDSVLYFALVSFIVFSFSIIFVRFQIYYINNSIL